MDLGIAIKYARIKRRMTQKDLATLAGFANGYISLIEAGKRDCKMATFVKIAEALQIPAFLLVFGAEFLDDARTSPIEEVIGSELAEKLCYEMTKIVRSNDALK